MVTIRWDIKTINRLSIIEDVLREFFCCDINITPMKVTPRRILIKSWCRQLQGISYVQPCLNQHADIINATCLYKEISELSTPEPERPCYLSNIICSSQSVHALIGKAIKITDSKYTILIRGDTGTGEGLLARAVHNPGQRRFYPFIPVNCSAPPEPPMESKFFGYGKGAFSGVDYKGRKGLFGVVDKGTLFLNEFDEMSLSLQVKLLRVPQDSGIRHVGGAHTIPVNVHIIVTTDADLEEMMGQRLLRVDLYCRINALSLTIPSLHERPQGTSLLIRHSVQKYAKELQRRITLDRACLDALRHHTWLGNVRESGGTIIRLMLMAGSDVITQGELGMVNLPAAERDVTERPFKEQVLCAERQFIEQMVEDNVSSRYIAKTLGVSYTTVLNKIRDYQLESVG